MHCNDVNSNILNALQLGKVTSRYTITARVGIIQSRLYTVMDSVRVGDSKTKNSLTSHANG